MNKYHRIKYNITKFWKGKIKLYLNRNRKKIIKLMNYKILIFNQKNNKQKLIHCKKRPMKVNKLIINLQKI